MKNKPLEHQEFIEALYDLNEKINKEFNIQVPATYFEDVVKVHAKVVKEIEKSKFVINN